MKKRTFEEFIKKAKEIHGNKYEYIKSDFDNSNYITYKCPKGTLNKQRKADHLKGKGCFCCRKRKNKLTINEIINKANCVHNNKYDYSLLTEHKNCKEKINVICHTKNRYGIEHGIFQVQLQSHLYDGCGCPKCAQEKRGFKPQITQTVFIEKANAIHNNFYIYDDKLNFINSRKNVTIKCPIHGYFTQNAHAHLSGQGCPHCKATKLEKTIMSFLTENNIEFVYQQKFHWLKRQSLDFYLPQYNVAIECQGIQHFQPIDFGGKGKEYAQNFFKHITELDTIKHKLCVQNGIKLLYFANKEYNNNVITEKEILLNKIKMEK